MAHIPTDVISTILCWLPVDTLLRFRSVCKFWRGLIDDPHFINMHLNRFFLNGDSSLYSVYSDSPNAQIRNHVVDACVTEVNHPIKRDESSTLVMGNCNGLILISNDVEDCGWWNPSTRKYRKLPNFKFMKPRGLIMGQYHAGLGYDQTTDDYKVARIMQACNLKNQDAYAETMAFSLKSGTWKRTKDFPFWMTQDAGGTYALGALYWVATDVASRVNFGVLEGFLCMSCNYILDRIDIWLLKKDHGETECWTKLLSVAQTDVNWCMENVKAITRSSSGKQILLEKDHEQLMWYDLEKKLVTKTWMPHRPRTFNAILCSESLVQVNGGSCGDDGVGKNTGKADSKQRQHKKRYSIN
ncbi:hypothetical protein CDL12_27338 [Handroanthus impetiginosus]|uniref:F-box domain-containing protein n=1 Tax=Handroanthus impetiginosus TaxID=429701 RepID=A0A2G9G4B1_9LAMI|nr:hypothetical protein CDL12_27338 [Handroanthus impetiginosus]